MHKVRRLYMKVFKAILAILMWMIYGGFYKVFYPVMNNTEAMNQMSISEGAYTSYAAFQWIWSVIPVALVVITILIFSKELNKLFIKIKEYIKESTK
jgi:uncharacterized membrane protein